ncbi:MAG: response regulator [Treponema sp.]|nr:response regulator [Treponema sp.]
MNIGKKYTILLVDDEKANLVVLNRILSDDYLIQTAKTGEQALQLIAKNKPDLVLLDIIMPDINGFEVLSKLTESENTADISVIFITGLTNPDDEEKGFALGAADYITKPFKPIVVKARINTQIKKIALMHMISDDLIRMSSIVESSPLFVLYLDANGKIAYINPAASFLSGYTKEDICKEGLALFLGPENSRRLQEEFLPCSKEKAVNFEMEVTRKDGEIRLFSFSVFTALLHNGEAGFGITAQDTTDLKYMQRRLVEVKDEAERALAQAEYYNKAKSGFISRMSHEMRTPMNAIMGMTTIARTVETEDRKNYCLDKIDESSRHLLGLIDNILDMAKIDTGLFELAPHKFYFSDMIEQLIADIAAKAEGKKQKFTTDIDPAIPVSLIADERRLRQVLFNLLINAITFTPAGGSIHFSAKRQDDKEGGCVVRFEVKDTGIGIPDEQKARLWDSFEQEDNSITRSYGGTGMGLSLVKNIVEMMHGTIEVESESGKGSRFICTVIVHPDRDVSGPETGGGNGTASLAGKHILVVDDVEINREIIFAILEDTNAVLDGAGNGEEAIELFRKNTYDLVLMDLHMPGMDGFETTRCMIATAKPGAVPPIIAITADTGDDVVSRCLEAGMNGRIGKPVDCEALIKFINSDFIPRSGPEAGKPGLLYT